MFRFAEWMALESLMEEVKRDIFLECVVTDSLDAIFGYLERGLLNEQGEEEEEEEESAELDNPFSGGEDAKPVYVDRDYVPDEAYDEKRELGRILNSLRVVRNDAKRERAEMVGRIKDLKKELDDADVDDLDSRSPLEALSDLVKLGYLKEHRAEKIKDAMIHSKSKKRRLGAENELRGKIAEAAVETGNEHEPSSASVAKKAIDEMFDAIKKVYGRRFKNLAWSNQSRVGEDQIGHQTYEEDELASETMIKLLGRFKKRQWNGNQLAPWEENDGILKSGELEHLRNFIFLTVRNLGSNMRKKKNSVGNPASRMKLKGQVASKDEKARIIKDDLEKGEISYYEEYMKAAKNNPLQDRIEGGPPLEFAFPANKKDSVRLAIMRDIEYMVTWTPSSREEMSMDEGSVRRTLEAYKSKFLKRSEGSLTYASTLGGKDDDSSMDNLLSGADARGMAQENPLSSAATDTSAGNMTNLAPISGAIKDAIEKIARSSEFGPSEAMALCIKLGIGFRFTSNGKIGRNEPKPTTLTVTDMSRMNSRSASSATKDCAGIIVGIGLGFAQISERWPSQLWKPSTQSVGEYLRGNERSRGAVQKFCDLFKF